MATLPQRAPVLRQLPPTRNKVTPAPAPSYIPPRTLPSPPARAARGPPHFRQRPSSVRRKGCIHALKTVFRSVLWPPVTDLDLPVFAVFSMVTDAVPARQLSHLLHSSFCRAAPAAAVAAATQPGCEFDETEAA